MMMMCKPAGCCRFITALLLCCAPLVQCAPAAPARGALVQKSTEPLISSPAQFHAALQAWVETAASPVVFRLSPALQSKWEELVESGCWGEYARKCSVRYLESGQVTLTLDYRDYVRLKHARRDAAARAALSAEHKQVLKLAEKYTAACTRPGMAAFEKVVALHDFLVNHARYDATGGGDIADVLVRGRGSCEAYSAAMCLMLEIAGVPARVVVGEAGCAHAWNLVKLGHEWYHVDVTWDDPIVAGGSQQELSHAYCGVSDAEISQTHSWNRSAYPRSGAIPSFYFHQNGRSYASFDSFWEAAMQACRAGQPRFEAYLKNYGNSQTFQKNLKRATQKSPGPSRIIWSGPRGASGPVIVSFGEKSVHL